jgi:Flp pilus assembly CpaF family ATPase
VRPPLRQARGTGAPGGLGWAIEELLGDPLVENIIMDGHDRVFVHRGDATKTGPELAADRLVAEDQR